MPVPSSNPPPNLRRTPASCRPDAAKPTGVQIPIFEHLQRRGPTPGPQTRSPRCCSEDYRRSSSLLIAADASTRVQQGDWPRCPFLRLFVKDDSVSPAGVSCALPCDTSALIDELLHVSRIEPQRTPARAHLDGRQVRFSLAGRMLHYP